MSFSPLLMISVQTPPPVTGLELLTWIAFAVVLGLLVALALDILLLDGGAAAATLATLSIDTAIWATVFADILRYLLKPFAALLSAVGFRDASDSETLYIACSLIAPILMVAARFGVSGTPMHKALCFVLTDAAPAFCAL